MAVSLVLAIACALLAVSSAAPPPDVALRCGISTTWELFGGCPRCVRAALATGNFSLWANRGTLARLDDHLLSRHEHRAATTAFVPTLFGAGALTGEVTAPAFWRDRRASKRVDPVENASATVLPWFAAEPGFLRHAQAVLGWHRPDLFGAAGPLCMGERTDGCLQVAARLMRAQPPPPPPPHISAHPQSVPPPESVLCCSDVSCGAIRARSPCPEPPATSHSSTRAPTTTTARRAARPTGAPRCRRACMEIHPPPPSHSLPSAH